MVHFPPNFDTSTQRPLVLNLHGGSGNMMNAQGFSMLNPVSDENNFIVAWPQGYGIAPPGFSWADGRNTSADQAGIDDVGFIDILIDTLTSRYNVDTSKIFICGFSNGGFMVQRIACELPNKFAAMASLGASMDTVLFQNCNPIKPVPFAFFNGTADPAMPYNGGPMQNPLVTPVVPVDSAVLFWVSHNNCQTTAPTYYFPDSFVNDESTAELMEFHECDCDASVRFYKLINGGHTWPGVFVASQAEVLGNTNRDINASVELWDFFNSHTLCDNATEIIDDYIKEDLFVYPNPESREIFLNLDQSESATIHIRNVVGHLLISTVNERAIDISPLSTGLYFLTISNGKYSQTVKFLKQ